MGEFERDVQASGTPIPTPRDNERCVLDTHRRLFPCEQEESDPDPPPAGPGRAGAVRRPHDLIHHPRLGWWIVSLGVRETKGADPRRAAELSGARTVHRPADLGAQPR